MLKASLPFVNDKKSIVFDATNSSKKKREQYIIFAQKCNYSIRCLHVETSLDESYKRNMNREESYKIAYSVYNKYYNEPTEKEGFVLIKY